MGGDWPHQYEDGLYIYSSNRLVNVFFTMEQKDKTIEPRIVGVIDIPESVLQKLPSNEGFSDRYLRD